MYVCAKNSIVPNGIFHAHVMAGFTSKKSLLATFFFFFCMRKLTSMSQSVSETFVYNFTTGQLDRFLRSGAGRSPGSPCPRSGHLSQRPGANVCVHEVTSQTFRDVVFDDDKVQNLNAPHGRDWERLFRPLGLTLSGTLHHCCHLHLL